ncbi:unnamed protein product [Didymodactylos carnosus]|uniref:DAGKc domain-containing protein n=1 Tax=Didymodactylos carnosus TaxID=1234261 RepID=A0A815K2A3_9BILA|nr:unnamed protein product [Didymodactylos carnosus]CAF1387001.1 unnamed protein product [Didymodactylos carnosus]CAF4070775.1 unnamed protein product [Didymodactylos carnosus]CAF4281826.1 unnamed protein product [Didymodactylos carnosus]
MSDDRAKSRRKRRQPTAESVKQAFENPDEPEEIDAPLNQSIETEQEPLHDRAFFTINNTTVEVELEDNVLTWSSLNGEIGSKEDSIRPSSSSKNRRSTKHTTHSLNLRDIYAVTPVYARWNWTTNVGENGSTVSSTPPVQNLQLRGFQLHAYEEIKKNILQEIVIMFQTSLPNQIEKWYHTLDKLVRTYYPPRNVLVLCNPYSGPRNGRYVYNAKIKPVLETAQYNVTYIEISDTCKPAQAITQHEGDFTNLYGLVIIIGGDGSVIDTLNAITRYLAKANRIQLDIDQEPPPLPFPLCIIPNGTTNIICHSIHGGIDQATPLFHLLFSK